jgi:uncharacterized membrane protein
VLEHLLEAWQGLPRELIAFLVSMLPIAELRGGLPVAVLQLGLPIWKAYWICVLGNFLPMIPLVFLLDPIARYLRRWKLFDRFFEWLFARTRRRGGIVERYEALGLILFVAIPLPVTGGWTGAAAAYVFGIRPRLALPAILAGILIAGGVVLAALQGVLHIPGLFASM